MKNKKLLLLLLPLLIGCNNTTSNNSDLNSKSSISKSTSSESTTSSSTSSNSSAKSSSSNIDNSLSSTTTNGMPEVLDLADTLKELALGVKVEVNGTEKYDNNTSHLYLQNASKEKEFSFIKYSDEERKNKALHEYYTSSNNDNYVYSTRLNINNTYNYYKMYNPYSSQYYTWDDGYNNPFLALDADDFEQVDEVTYSLRMADLNNISASLTNLLYGNPGLNLTAFTMYLEEGELKFEALANFEGSTSYEYAFAAKVLDLGEKVEMDFRDVPFENVNDSEFEEMLALLKANNYTATIINYDEGIEDFTSVYYSNPDKIYYETPEYQSGFYLTEEGLIQEVKNVNGEFYKTGAPTEGSMNEVMPSFNVSRAVFDLNDDVYTLKSGVEGELSAFVVLETYADSLDEFEIKKITDGYELRNILGDYETVVTFTDIGTTDVGYTADTVLEPVAAKSFADVLEPESYQNIINMTGEEGAAMIPVPDNYDVWYDLTEEPESFIMLVAEAGESIDDDIYSYYLKLTEAGILISEEEGYMNGGIMALIPVEVDGVEHLVVVEFMEYEGMFCIVIYLGDDL